jgi:hypothetical protein
MDAVSAGRVIRFEKRIVVRLATVLVALALAFSTFAAVAGPADAWIPDGICTHTWVGAGPLTRWYFTRTLANYPVHEHEYNHKIFADPFWIHYDYDSSAPCP